MGFWDSKDTRTKIFLIQIVVVIVLIIGFRLMWPRLERARTAQEAAKRERKIEAAFHALVTEVPEPGGNGGASSKELRSAASIGDLERTLGAPEATITDYAGGLHLSWTGTDHKLEAALNNGRLYALTLTDLKTGHGEMVFTTAAESRSF